MSETEQRRAFSAGRVLIESGRVLDPQFDDSLVCLTGAELELLRNVCAYLHRRETYVDTYHGGYYMMPDDEDFDDVQAIVAGLEEKLMGCAEMEALLTSIDGYLASIAFDTNLLNLARPKLPASDTQATQSDGVGAQYCTFDAVEEGYILEALCVIGYGTTAAYGSMQVEYLEGATWRRLTRDAPCLVSVPYGLYTPIVLQWGEQLRCNFGGTANLDNLRATMIAFRTETP